MLIPTFKNRSGNIRIEFRFPLKSFILYWVSFNSAQHNSFHICDGGILFLSFFPVIFRKQGAQLVEALRYKSEVRGFDSRLCHLNFSLIKSFRPHYGPGVDSTSNRNEYQEYFLGGKGGRCIGLTTLPPSCADCLEIWDPQPPGTLRACPGL